MLQVIKRNGQKVPFDTNKIVNAVMKAYKEIYPNNAETLVKSFANYAVNNIVNKNNFNTLDDTDVDIEDIQDEVEKFLMETDKIVAKAYITYRYKRALARDRYKLLMKDVQEKLSGENVQNQNANLDEHSFGGRMGETTDLVMKRYSLDYCMSEISKNNHLNNKIYIHDLSHYAVGDHNCLSIPFDDLLVNGFNTRQTDVRPAQSVSTAFQLIAVIFQLQSLQQFGGVSATHLDWTMVPYVRKSFAKHFKDGVRHIKNDKDYVNTIPNEMSFNDPEANCKQNKQIYKYAYDICRHHHERWDGRGYPDGLAGEEISMWSQIVALADVYDALTTDRVYKKAFTHEESLRMILNGECGQFNPMLMETLRDLSEEIKAMLLNRIKK